MTAAVLDPVALADWYVVATENDLDRAGTIETQLLGRPITVARPDGAPDAVTVTSHDAAGAPLALQVSRRYGHIFAAYAAPAKPVFALPEANEADRRLVVCGGVLVRASGLRLVENFLDMAHFPFVHTDILGVPDHADVADYQCEIRRDVDEVWATNCRFWQPLAALNAAGGQVSHYVYRIATPFTVLLYKTNPVDPARQDVIGLAIQPLDEDRSRAFAFMLVVDDTSMMTDIIHFQQTIFLQDRSILENQRPTRLPLDAGAEIPTRADLSSIAYRRWLKEKGLRYGVAPSAAA